MDTAETNTYKRHFRGKKILKVPGNINSKKLLTPNQNLVKFLNLSISLSY